MKLKNRFPLHLETKEDARKLFKEFKACIPAAEYEDQNGRRALNGVGQFIDFLSGVKPKKRKSYSGYSEKTDWPTD